jgi:hypothetical protein
VYNSKKANAKRKQMEIKPQTIRNLQIGGIVITLVLIALAIYQTVSNSLLFTSDEKNSQKTANISVKSSAPTEPLPYLPEDFPIDKKAQVANNYVVNSPEQTDTEQYTRTYSSTRSLSDLYNMYLSYFTKNTWTVRNKALTKEVALISATRDRAAVNISIQQLNSVRMIVLTVNQTATPFVPEDPNQNGADFPTSSR